MKNNLTLENLTILIVEDVETSIRFFKAALSNTKAKLLYAESGKEAINKILNFPEISLVLLDLNLPDVNGFEVLRYIREKDSKLPVIVQTAYILSGEKEKSFALGANYFLEKPIHLDKLYKTIENCLK
jgi:CheY-like chemotaxis protein